MSQIWKGEDTYDREAQLEAFLEIDGSNLFLTDEASTWIWSVAT